LFTRLQYPVNLIHDVFSWMEIAEMTNSKNNILVYCYINEN